MPTALPSPDKVRKSNYNGFILIFVAIKIGLNFIAVPHFGLQRDELLHLTLADHLDWGFIEVPPFIALLAKVTLTLFGNSVFAARLFPTICSGLIIWISALITLELGGKKFAITLTCLALIFSPAFAASGYLFEPVVFDQLWWVLSVWLLMRYSRTTHPKYIYLLGAVIGLGLLTKYTMGFFAVALVLSILISPERQLLFTRHVVGSFALALIIFLPNLVWQFQYHLPVISQMAELKEQQLDLLTPLGFATQELVDNGMGLLVWLPGLILLLVSADFRRYRFLPIAFILIFLFYMVMNGKNYYLFGAYPMLFAAGAVGYERWLETSRFAFKAVIVVFIALPNLLIFPIALPVLSLSQTIAVFKTEQTALPILNFVVTWDDQQIHPISQNYGAMLGWDELTEKVVIAWRMLTPEQQRHTQIFADNYGEASAITYYGKRYHLPAVVSLSSSFALWAPEDLAGEYIIYIDEQKGKNIETLPSKPVHCLKIGAIENPLAVEKGTAIFLLINPGRALNQLYQQELAGKRF